MKLLSLLALFTLSYTHLINSDNSDNCVGENCARALQTSNDNVECR